MTSDAPRAVTIADLANFAYRDRWLFAGIVSIVLGIAIVTSFLVTPVYRAEILLMPTETGDSSNDLSLIMNRLGGLASLAGVSAGGGGNTDEAVAVLESREFTYRFIQENGILEKLFFNKWDAKNGKWDVEALDEEPTLEDGYKRIQRKVRDVVRDRDTGFVRVAVEWTDAKLAASWANKMVEQLNARMREIAIAEAERSIEYLNVEIARTNVVELKQAIYGLIESQINSIMLANVRTEYVFKVIDPAIVSEEDDYVWPKRSLIILAGLILGMFSAGLLTSIRGLISSNR